jgi:SAM-dependent methyltransferase
VTDTSPPRTGFGDVDASGAADHLIGYLDAARTAPSIRDAKSKLLDRLQVSPGDRTLDVGCGTGEDVVAMAEAAGPRGYGVGIDSSKAMITEARHRHGHDRRLSFQIADGQSLPIGPATFDACRSERTLQHTPDPARAVAEMVRVLNPRGRIALMEPDWGTLIVNGPDLALADKVLGHHVRRHLQPDMGRRLRGLLAGHDIDDIEVDAGVTTYTDLPSAFRAFGLFSAAQRAASAGVISEAEVEQWTAELARADQDSTFFASVTGYRTWGRKRGPDH